MTLFILILLFWLSLHVSQSLMDLTDGLLVVYAIFTAIREKEFKKLISGYAFPWLWAVWIFVLALGFIEGPGVTLETALLRMYEFRWFVSFTCFIYLFNRIDWDRKMITSLLTIFATVSVGSFIIFFAKGEERAGGFFNHSMPFAHTMGPSVLWFTYLGLKKILSNDSLKEKLFWSASLILGTTLIILSFTRGVWIGFVLGLLGTNMFLGRKLFLPVLIGTAMVATVLFVGSNRIQNRVMGAKTEQESNLERVRLWTANILIFMDYPTVGIGYGENTTHLREYFDLLEYPKDQLEGHAHNQFLQFLAGTGMLGLACFLFFIWSILWPAGKYLRKRRISIRSVDLDLFALGAFAALICFLIGGMTEANFGIAKNRFVFLFLAAFLTAYVQKQCEQKNTEENGC